MQATRSRAPLAERADIITFDDFMRSAPYWTAQDLAKTRALVAELMLSAAKRPSAAQSAFLDALRNYLKSEIGLPGPSNAKIFARKNGIICAFLLHAVEVVEAFTAAARLPPPHTERDITAVSAMYCHLVGKRLRAQNRPVTLLALLRPADDFPALFDHAFPGYVKNGIAAWVLRRRTPRPAATTEQQG